MKVNICGIPHEIVECEDSFTADATHKGIPNAIIVWLKDGTKVIYIAESENEE